MARRKSPAPSIPPTPYVKTELQLKQWAAYEALTAIHDAEFSAKSKAGLAVVDLFACCEKWQKAQNIRQFVTSTMAQLPADASQTAIDAAEKWQAWALGVANDNDPSLFKAKEFLRATVSS